MNKRARKERENKRIEILEYLTECSSDELNKIYELISGINVERNRCALLAFIGNNKDGIGETAICDGEILEDGSLNLEGVNQGHMILSTDGTWTSKYRGEGG